VGWVGEYHFMDMSLVYIALIGRMSRVFRYLTYITAKELDIIPYY